jgi:hypothetical protein
MHPKRNSPAPQGYLYERDESGERVVVLDSAPAAIMRRAYADRTRSRLGLAIVRLIRRFRRPSGHSGA